MHLSSTKPEVSHQSHARNRIEQGPVRERETDSEMGDDCTRIILRVESLEHERVVVASFLNSFQNLTKEFNRSIDENLIEVLLLTNGIQEFIEPLDPRQLAGDSGRIA